MSGNPAPSERQPWVAATFLADRTVAANSERPFADTVKGGAMTTSTVRLIPRPPGDDDSSDHVAVLGVHHVKLPVTDLCRSAAWYARTFGFVTRVEFVEHDLVRGLVLRHPAGFALALRDRRATDRQTDLAGFDPFALAYAGLAGLEAFAERCDRIGVAHSPIVETKIGWAMQVPDPDGILVRCYADDPARVPW
jgi:catechol 2,3-dioxygenase-like lactoylglutathione lyase family enzyme